MIRGLLLIRAASTLGLERRDWMKLSAHTELWAEIQAMAQRPGEKNAEWAQQPSVPWDQGSKLAEAELATLRKQATNVVDHLRSMAAELATLLCQAIFTESAEPSPTFPTSNDYFTAEQPAGLQQSSNEEQAALTRMSRFTALRGDLHALLEQRFETSAKEFEKTALEMIWRCAPAVDLVYERGGDSGAVRCRPHYRAEVGHLGHHVLQLWLETVVQPVAQDTQRLAVNEEMAAESCSKERVELLSTAVTVAEVVVNLLAMQRKYRLNPPAWAALVVTLAAPATPPPATPDTAPPETPDTAPPETPDAPPPATPDTPPPETPDTAPPEAGPTDPTPTAAS
jgi:hypothetical protein